MNRSREQTATATERRRTSWLLILISGCLLTTFTALFLPRARQPKPAASNQSVAAANAERGSSTAAAPDVNAFVRSRFRSGAATAGESAEEIVARRTAQFARSRRDILHRIAKKRNVAVPEDVERFFDAAEAGNWPEVQRLFNALVARYKGQPPSPELQPFWGPIFATFGPLEEAHLWPAQEFLDYGNAILSSLKPGMVYVGGTDPGRFIPELMADTGDADPHMVLTQNALADPSYLDYLRDIYGNRLGLPSQDEVQRAFQDYVADLQKRMAHDQQFPDEPRQVQPGESLGPGSGGWTASIKQGDGTIQVSGQLAAMAINERILQMILDKNPDMSFGLEESFPLKSFYASAAPLGPITELRAPDGANALNADTAAQSVAYWQTTAQQLLSDPEATGSDWTMRAYSKMVDAQANLFISHGLNDEAEQAFNLSLQLCPYSPEAVYGYVQLLMNQNRTADAMAVAQAATRADPNNQQFQNLADQLKKAAKR